MLPLLIAVIAFTSILLLVVGLASGRDPAIQARLGSIRGGADQWSGTDLTLPFERRVLQPALLGVGRWLAVLLPPVLLSGLRKTLIMAGNPMSVNGFLAFGAMSAALPLLAVTAVLTMGGVKTSPVIILVMLLLVALGAVFPLIWLRGRVRHRQQLILKSLPDALDLVTTSVEAGLGLDAAFARVVEKTKGPFAEELGRALRETAMGRLRREALTDLGQRTGVRDLTTFINTIIQAEQLGVSIAQVLRVQSEQMRSRRRQRAEEAAHRAPIYLVFPLVLCIFPALMIVMMGPGVIRIFDSFVR